MSTKLAGGYRSVFVHQRRLSMTYDQGREMSQYEKLSERTGDKVYFAGPRSSWQRGINQNTNGLLR